MKIEQKKETTLPFLLFLRRSSLAIFLISGAVFAYGYRFPSVNHITAIPPILSLLDPNLFSQDYFVQEMLDGFTARTYYYYLFYFPAKIGFGIPLLSFIYYVAALASLIVGLQAIARIFCQSYLSTVLLAFWGLSVTSGFIGGTELFSQSPIPAIYAMGLAIWGVYFSLRRAWVIAYAFFGFTCLLQFLVGLLPALAIVPLLILDTWRTRQWIRGGLAFFLLILGASAIYVPMMLQGNTGSDLLTSQEFVEIYGYIATPFHIVPSAWGKNNWIRFFLFYAGGLLCLYQTRTLSFHYRFGLSAVVGMTFFALLLNFIFVEILPSATVAKLQFGRMTPFAELAILIGLTALFDEQLKQRNWIVCGALATIPVSHYPGFLLLAFALGLGLLKGLSSYLKSKSYQWLAIAIAVFLVVVLYRLPPVSRGIWANPRVEGPLLFGVLLVPHLVAKWLQKERARAAVALALAVVMAGTLLLGISSLIPGRFKGAFSSRVAFYRVPPDPISKLALRFRDLSQKDALVLIPPSIHHFKLFSQRAVVVEYKSFPQTDRGVVEWKTRFEAVLGVPLNKQSYSSLAWFESDKLYRSRSSLDLVKVARRYGAKYILTGQDWHPDMPGEEVAREKQWVIWKIPNQDKDESKQF